MKIYSVKWCLTQGIIEHDSLIEENGSVRLGYSRLNKGEYATDLETAREMAEYARAKKIANMKKQIANLEQLTF